jgi:poly(3-hydroxybutyrate) depolymerase
MEGHAPQIQRRRRMRRRARSRECTGYTVARYSDGHGGELLQYWEVHGMAHAWSGGCSCEQYADPSGPDETVAMYGFMSHPAP